VTGGGEKKKKVAEYGVGVEVTGGVVGWAVGEGGGKGKKEKKKKKKKG